MDKYTILVSLLRIKNRNTVYKSVFVPDDFLKGILGHSVFSTKRFFSSYNYKQLLQRKTLSEYLWNGSSYFCKKQNS